MTLLQKLQAIVDALNEINTLLPIVQTALTNFSAFLDTV